MTGLECFLDGFQLIRRPGLRRYFIVPCLINAVVLTLLVVLSYSHFGDWVAIIVAWFPDWMSALYWLVWGISLIVLLVLILFVFTFVANIIASPFNAILSIKVEQVLTGAAPVSTVSPWLILPRSVARELGKLRYILPRLLGLLLITIIPVINTVAPFLWVLFGAWMMSIQYADYAADNNDVSFGELQSRMRARRFDALMFGLPAYLLLTVPVVNLVLMPIGVAGGTRFWVEHLR
jgi:CysZ protein